MLISVATGGRRIKEVGDEYRRRLVSVSEGLGARGIENPIPYVSLWDWHGRWSSGDLPSYRSRRQFVGELLNPLVARIKAGRGAEQFRPTGWVRVDRVVGDLRDRLAAAKVEEDFQTVGLLCREVLISLGQAVLGTCMMIERLADAAPIGLAAFYFNEEIGDAESDFLIALMPEHQRMGYGRAILVELAKRWMTESKRDYCTAMVSQRNSPSISLLGKLGFTKVGECESKGGRSDVYRVVAKDLADVKNFS